MQSTFKIGELAALYGIGPDTVRYYEEQGLIQPRRGENGYRLYSIQDIWRMNVIRDLRALGFPVERIRTYLEEHSVESTLGLLAEELAAIEEKLEELTFLRQNVCQRIETIRSAETRALETIEQAKLPAYRCQEICESFTTDEEMDLLIKRLLNRSRRRLYIIGSSGVGARIQLAPGTGGKFIAYRSALILDDSGDTQLPGGHFLLLRYRGSSRQTPRWLPKMARYAKAQGLSPTADAREFIRIDIHEASDIREHITELQLRVE